MTLTLMQLMFNYMGIIFVSFLYVQIIMCNFIQQYMRIFQLPCKWIKMTLINSFLKASAKLPCSSDTNDHPGLKKNSVEDRLKRLGQMGLGV